MYEGFFQYYAEYQYFLRPTCLFTYSALATAYWRWLQVLLGSVTELHVSFGRRAASKDKIRRDLQS